MTICTALVTRDGIVLGCDSQSLIIEFQPEEQTEQIAAYRSANKLQKFGNFPIAVLTYGLGNIGSNSIYDLVNVWAASYVGESEPEAICSYLIEKLKADLRQNWPVDYKMPELGMIVAGYSRRDGFPKRYEILLPNNEKPKFVGRDNSPGFIWRGITGPFARLFYGIDPLLLQWVADHTNIFENNNEMLAQARINFDWDSMNLNSAIEFTEFVLELTINYQRYLKKPAHCDYPLKIATITKNGGWSWCSNPELDTGPINFVKT